MFHLQYCYSGVSAAPDTALQTATPVTESTSAPGTTSTVTAATAEATTVTQVADVPVTQQAPAGECTSEVSLKILLAKKLICWQWISFIHICLTR